MININSILSSNFNKEDYNFNNSYIVMIDVLRASSVIVTAFKNKVDSIIPVVTIEEAKKIKQTNNEFYLAGERNSIKIDGFDFGNSPLEYIENKIKNKRLIFTSTNGAKIFTAGTSAYKRVIGSFINFNIVLQDIFSYIYNEISNKNEINIFFVCAGTNSKYSLEDGTLAGKFIYEILKQHKEINLCDSSDILKNNFIYNKENLIDYLKTSKHSLYLESLGLEKDIEYCFSNLNLEILPIVKEDNIIRL